MNVSARASLGLVAAQLVVFAAACLGSTSTTSEPADAGGDATLDATLDGAAPDGSQLDVADAGAGLFPADTTKIVVSEKGGFVPSPPDGSTCAVVDATYTLLLPARELSWKVCDDADGGPYFFVTGQKTLSAQDYDALSDALHGLRRATQTACGADKPAATVVFTTPAGDTTYYDDFYFCDPADTKPYVTGVDAVLAELRKLAQ